MTSLRPKYFDLLFCLLILLGSLHSLLADTFIVIQRGNLRKTPSTDSIVIGKLDVGLEVTVKEQKDEWYKIQVTPDLEGWAHKILLSSMSSDSLQSYDILTVNRYGNLRRGPGTEYPVIAKLIPDQKLLSVEKNGEWYKVMYADNDFAWIHQVLLQSTESKGPVQPQNKVIIQKSGNVRSGPGTDFTVIEKVSPNENVALLEEQGEWLKIRLSDELSGWIHKMLIQSEIVDIQSEIPIPPESTPSDTSISIVKYITEAKALRKSADYSRAVQYYQTALAELEKLLKDYGDDECVRFYYTKCQYSLLQSINPNDDSRVSKALETANRIKAGSDCFPLASQCATSWSQATKIRSLLLNILSEDRETIRSVLADIEKCPDYFPLASEAEAYRFIGLYYLYLQGEYRRAAECFQRCCTIYGALIDNGIELNATHTEYRFRAYVESGIAYSKIKKYQESFSAFDQAHTIARTANNEKWMKYYQKTLSVLSKQN